MHIANPIYDVIFKYLLEDNKVAKLLLSAIIGENIEELDFGAQEQTVEIENPDKEKPSFTVCRLDFSAKIKTETGFKTVKIELQKAKLQTDLMRFRRYLGVHYQKSDNTYQVTVEQKNGPALIIDKPREIYCIYFLAYGMDLPKSPVLKVDYALKDAYSGKEYPATAEFVSSLHHSSWIVQINEIKKNRRNKLEKILSIFDQSATTDTKHILEIDDNDFPEEYRDIIRRLRKAMGDPANRRKMELEDDIISEIQGLERRIKAQESKIEQQESKIEQQESKIEQQESKIESLQSENMEQAKVIEELKKLLEIK